MTSNVIALLRAYQIPLSVDTALAYLSDLADAFGKLYLYQKFFPEQFALSAGLPLPQQFETYSQKELEFFKLVDQHLFDLSWEFYQDENDNGGERDNTIWVQSLGLDWWEYEPDEIPESWLVLLFLTANFELTQLGLAAEFDEVLVERKKGRLNWAELERDCQLASSPLNILTEALTILDHDTGNVWLDSTSETPYDRAFWCEEDIIFLTDKFREASVSLERVEEFFDWMLAKPENLREVVELWNRNIQP